MSTKPLPVVSEFVGQPWYFGGNRTKSKQLMFQYEQAIEALKVITGVLEPLYSKHTEGCISCAGCRYEWNDALITAMNVLAGLETGANWGPGHTSETICPPDDPCQQCLDHHPTKEEIDQAWMAAGFTKTSDGEWLCRS